MKKFEDENINLIIRYMDVVDKYHIFTKRRKFSYDINKHSTLTDNQRLIHFIFSATKRKNTEVLPVVIDITKFYKWKKFMQRKIKILKIKEKLNEYIR